MILPSMMISARICSCVGVKPRSPGGLTVTTKCTPEDCKMHPV